MKLSMLVISGFLVYGVAHADDGPALTPKSLQAALSANPVGPAAEQLAERVRGYFGGSAALLKGAAPKIDELTVAWAIEAQSLPAGSAGPEGGGRCRRLHSAVDAGRNDRRVRGGRNALSRVCHHVALRAGRQRGPERGSRVGVEARRRRTTGGV